MTRQILISQAAHARMSCARLRVILRPRVNVRGPTRATSDTTFRVKVAIPCPTSSNALEHERLADIDPVALDADALLHRLAFGAAPVSAVHFGLLDCTSPTKPPPAHTASQQQTAARLELERHGDGERKTRPRRDRNCDATATVTPTARATATRPDGHATGRSRDGYGAATG
jgi:hypothetical protein